MEKDNQFTFYDGLIMIWKHKISFILSLILTAVIILTVFLVLRSFNHEAEVSFYYSFYKSETYRYPDQSRFSYTDIISKSRLETIKKSDAKYSNINIQELSKNDIGISAVTEENQDIMKYQIHVKMKEFGNDELLASSFISDLIFFEVSSMESKIVSNLFYYLGNMDIESMEYLFQIDLLEKQYIQILDKYQLMMETFGYGIDLDGETVESRITQVQALSNSALNFSRIRRTTVDNGYVLSATDSPSVFDVYISELEHEINMVEKNIDSLEDLLTEYPNIGDQVLNQIAEEKIKINELNYILDAYKKMKDSGVEAPSEYVEMITQAISETNTLVDQFNSDYKGYLKNLTVISLDTEGSILKITNSYSILIGVTLSVVAGLGIGIAVVYLKYKLDQQKQKNKGDKEQ